MASSIVDRLGLLASNHWFWHHLLRIAACPVVDRFAAHLFAIVNLAYSVSEPFRWQFSLVAFASVAQLVHPATIEVPLVGQASSSEGRRGMAACLEEQHSSACCPTAMWRAAAEVVHLVGPKLEIPTAFLVGLARPGQQKARVRPGILYRQQGFEEASTCSYCRDT